MVARDCMEGEGEKSTFTELDECCMVRIHGSSLQ